MYFQSQSDCRLFSVYHQAREVRLLLYPSKFISSVSISVDVNKKQTILNIHIDSKSGSDDEKRNKDELLYSLFVWRRLRRSHWIMSEEYFCYDWCWWCSSSFWVEPRLKCIAIDHLHGNVDCCAGQEHRFNFFSTCFLCSVVESWILVEKYYELRLDSRAIPKTSDQKVLENGNKVDVFVQKFYCI